jgi:hypothetical protein
MHGQYRPKNVPGQIRVEKCTTLVDARELVLTSTLFPR